MKRKGTFLMMRVIFFIAVIAIIFGVESWVGSIPPKIESGETLVFHDAYTYDEKLKVWYPLEKRSETYDVGETLGGISFLNKDTILAISLEREAVVEYNLNRHSFTEICSLKSIADSFSQAAGLNVDLFDFTLPTYFGEKYLALAFKRRTDGIGMDAPKHIFLYDLQYGTVDMIGCTYSMWYEVDKTKLRYVDAVTREVVEIDANNPSRKITDRISRTISHGGTMQISDNDELLSVDTGEVLGSLERVIDPVDFTFSSDDQYIAFYYHMDELLYSRQTGHACVYDWKKDRLYDFSTKEYMRSGARIDWLPA